MGKSVRALVFFFCHSGMDGCIQLRFSFQLSSRFDLCLLPPNTKKRGRERPNCLDRNPPNVDVKQKIESQTNSLIPCRILLLLRLVSCPETIHRRSLFFLSSSSSLSLLSIFVSSVAEVGAIEEKGAEEEEEKQQQQKAGGGKKDSTMYLHLKNSK